MKNSIIPEFRSLGEYVKTEHINISQYKIRKLITSGDLEFTDKVVVHKKYRALDTLVLDNNLSCSLEASNPAKSLYVLNMYKDGVKTDTVKLGVSGCVKTRIESINSSSEKYGYIFELRFATKGTYTNAFELEKSIATILKTKHLHHQLDIKFSGSTELYRYDKCIVTLLEMLSC